MKPVTEQELDRAAVAELKVYFRRNGYVRRPNEDRRTTEGCGRYKKGTELRFVADTREELRRIRALLERTGVKPGSPFRKGRQYRQPVYGGAVVERLLHLLK